VRLNLFSTALLLLGLLLVSCGQAQTPAGPSAGPSAQPATAPPTGTLTVMTHDSFDASQAVIDAFRAACHCDVRFLKSGDAGLMLNQALLSKDHPLADVLFGVDNTFLSRALKGDILDPYPSPALAGVPDALKLDPTFRLLPVDYGDVCLNYDRAWFEQHHLAPPGDIPDLIDPLYKGLAVVENPATSSPGLAFLLATIWRYGEIGEYNYLNFWADLRANDLLVADGWDAAYYGDFTYTSEGDRPIVVSYASSPPVEVLFSGKPFEQAPTAAVVADGACFRQVEFVGILKGTPNRDLAEKWIDFMLSTAFQEDMPLQMYVFPVNPAAKLPEVFTKFTSIPDETAQVSPQDISQNREQWIKAWTESVLR
jgi:thiamine transport system substrate-binding protein